LKRGDKVIWISSEIPGTVVATQDGYVQIDWAEGPLSSRPHWCPSAWFGEHIELIGDNGHKAKVPESLIDPTGRDLFAEAFQRFEL
jgi:hypothetical protein